MDGIRDYFMEYLTSMDISQAYVLRGDHRIIVFLHSPERPADKTLYDCAGLLAQKLIKVCPFFISLGPVVSGMDRAHISYQEASEHLKEAFFHDYGFILTRNMETAVFRPPADLLLEFSMALSEKQEEEAQRKADEQLAKKAQEETKQASASAGSNTSAGNNSGNSSSAGNNSSSGNNNPSNNNSSNNTSSDSSNSGSGGYVIPSGGLTPSKGRIWYNGHTETYYSQKVLPGGGLAIPGRHIASDGTIRDADGYIVLASDDYPRGTVVETSLGAGKVYDTGSGSGNIDLYTDW